MGYLDNSTITVDAILTKKGRQLLSAGGNLNITHFTLSDTGVDYTLWNADHTSGSAYYGEAIENTPQQEALPAVYSGLRNKLVTLNRDVVAMPTVEVEPASLIFSTPDPKDFSVKLLGYNPPPGIGGGDTTLLIIPDINKCYSTSGTQVDITGNALSFVSDQDIASARAVTVTGNSVKISPSTNLASDTNMLITIIDNSTGAYDTATITVEADLEGEVRLAGKGKTRG